MLDVTPPLFVIVPLPWFTSAVVGSLSLHINNIVFPPELPENGSVGGVKLLEYSIPKLNLKLDILPSKPEP